MRSPIWSCIGRTRVVPGDSGGGIPGNGGCAGLAFWRFFSGRGLAKRQLVGTHPRSVLPHSPRARGVGRRAGEREQREEQATVGCESHHRLPSGGGLLLGLWLDIPDGASPGGHLGIHPVACALSVSDTGERKQMIRVKRPESTSCACCFWPFSSDSASCGSRRKISDSVRFCLSFAQGFIHLSTRIPNAEIARCGAIRQQPPFAKPGKERAKRLKMSNSLVTSGDKGIATQKWRISQVDLCC